MATEDWTKVSPDQTVAWMHAYHERWGRSPYQSMISDDVQPAEYAEAYAAWLSTGNRNHG